MLQISICDTQTMDYYLRMCAHTQRRIHVRVTKLIWLGGQTQAIYSDQTSSVSVLVYFFVVSWVNSAVKYNY